MSKRRIVVALTRADVEALIRDRQDEDELSETAMKKIVSEFMANHEEEDFRDAILEAAGDLLDSML